MEFAYAEIVAIFINPLLCGRVAAIERDEKLLVNFNFIVDIGGATRYFLNFPLTGRAGQGCFCDWHPVFTLDGTGRWIF